MASEIHTWGGHGLSGKRPPQSLFKARRSSAWANTRPRCRTPLYRRRSASFTCANGTTRYSLSLGREMPAGGLGPAPAGWIQDPDGPTAYRQGRSLVPSGSVGVRRSEARRSHRWLVGRSALVDRLRLDHYGTTTVGTESRRYRGPMAAREADLLIREARPRLD